MKAPTTRPTRVDFPVFQPFKDSHEAPTKRTSHEGVHGSAHESVQSSGQGSPAVFSLVLFVGQKPKTYCENSSLAILSFTPILIVRSGPVWRPQQHLPTTGRTHSAILSFHAQYDWTTRVPECRNPCKQSVRNKPVETASPKQHCKN